MKRSLWGRQGQSGLWEWFDCLEEGKHQVKLYLTPIFPEVTILFPFSVPTSQINTSMPQLQINLQTRWCPTTTWKFSKPHPIVTLKSTGISLHPVTLTLSLTILPSFAQSSASWLPPPNSLLISLLPTITTSNILQHSIFNTLFSFLYIITP